MTAPAAERLEMSAAAAGTIADLLNTYATAIETGDGVKADPEIAAWLSSRADAFLFQADNDRELAARLRQAEAA